MNFLRGERIYASHYWDLKIEWHEAASQKKYEDSHGANRG